MHKSSLLISIRHSLQRIDFDQKDNFNLHAMLRSQSPLTENHHVLVSHRIQLLCISCIHIFVTIAIDGIVVKGVIVRQVVSAIAALGNTTCNHFRRNLLTIVDHAQLCEEINDDRAEIVVSNVTEFTASVVVWESVMIVVIAIKLISDSRLEKVVDIGNYLNFNRIIITLTLHRTM